MKSNKSRPGKSVSVSDTCHTERKDEEGAIGRRDGKSKDGEWPENRAFSSLAPLAGDTELTETTKPEAKAQLVASQPRHGHHHITMKPSSPGHWHPSQEGMGGNSEPGVADVHSPAGSFSLALYI